MWLLALQPRESKLFGNPQTKQENLRNLVSLCYHIRNNKKAIISRTHSKKPFPLEKLHSCRNTKLENKLTCANKESCTNKEKRNSQSDLQPVRNRFPPDLLGRAGDQSVNTLILRWETGYRGFRRWVLKLYF